MMYLSSVLAVSTILCLILSPVCCTLQCYMGSVGVNGHSLVNTTCDHILSHNMPVMGDGHNVTHTQVNYSLHHPDNDNSVDISYCVIFKYSDREQTDYHCDYEYICSNKTLAFTDDQRTRTGVTVKGSLGTLHCCKPALCNDRATGTALPAASTSKPATGATESMAGATQPSSSPSIQCYHGTSTTFTVRTCAGIRWCLHSVLHGVEPGVNVIPYSCDTQGRCDANSLSDGQCANVTDTQSGVKRLICCCSSDICNKDGLQTTVPSGSKTKASDETKTTSESSENYIGNQPLSTMPPHIPPNKSPGYKHWMFIGGIVAGIMFGTLMFIVVAIVIKRYKQQRETLLTYSYTQLTADLADDRETDDERMLVG